MSIAAHAWGTSGYEGAVPTYGALAVAVVAACSGVVVLRSIPSTGRGILRSWQLFGASLFAWSTGAFLTFVSLQLDPGAPSFGEAYGVGNLGYLAAVAMQVASVVSHPALSPRVVRMRTFANALIVSTSLATLMWFCAARHLHDRTGDVISTLVTLAYPSIDALLVMLSVSVAVRVGRSDSRHAAAMRSTTLLIGGAFTVFMMGDVRELALRAHDFTPVVPLLAESGWLVGFLFVALAARIARRSAHAERSERRQRARSEVPLADTLMLGRSSNDTRLAAALSMAPVVAAVLAGAAAAVDWRLRHTVDPTGLLMLTAVISMVLVRQSVTLSDNRRLGDSLEQAVAQLERQATHDRLTGLPNRSSLDERIRDAVRRGTGSRHRAALLFVDLDHLKPVNDSLGHAAGDHLLRVTAERITARVGARVTRFGGDEFVVLLDDLPAAGLRDSVERISGRIVEDTAQPIEIEGHVIRPSVSIGIATAEGDVTPEELLRRADAALYRAKARGRRCVAVYDPDHEADARRQIDLEYELRRALRDDEFEVHYQPVVEIATGQVVGVESLLRWRHPTHGMLTPDSFLSAAATCGLLGQIGECTLMQACADLSAITWNDGPPPTVAVNLSTTELTDHRVVARVRAALETYGMDPSRLVIEITEDVVVDDRIRTTIDALRSLEVQLAIDDFGTGNSSLRQLGTYPASTLKIDRSFITPLGEDPQATAIVRAIVGLARNLGLRTVAEGVETHEQAAVLQGLGCSYAQGWLFARAMSIDELELQLLGDLPSLSAAADRPTPHRPAMCAQPESRASVDTASVMMRSSSASTGGRSSIAPTT